MVIRLKLLALALGVAIAAVDRPSVSWLERHLGVLAASSANRREHLPLTTFLYAQPLLLGSAASRTALGVIGETFFGIEFLLGGGKREICLAVYARESSVLVAQG
jgi:hypothetical protein